MKILYLGNYANRDSSLGYAPNAWWIQKTLEELGHEVTGINEKDVEAQELLALLPAYDLLLTEEARLKGDHVSTEEGENIIRGLFQEVVDKSQIPIICWLSNIFMGIDQREIEIETNPIFKADIVFSTDGGHQKEFQEKGVNHHCLRMGIYEPEAVLGEPIYSTKAEIVFVGSLYEHIWPYRKQLVDWLQATYGDRFLHVGQRGEVRHQELNNLLATVKIVVGDSVYSPGYWSNRVYEMIGRGGFLIHPMIEGLEKEFEPYKHFIPYNYGDFDGLKQKIDYFLSHDEEREAIKLAGFEHCKKHHTYRQRVEEMLRVLKEEGICA